MHMVVVGGHNVQAQPCEGQRRAIVLRPSAQIVHGAFYSDRQRGRDASMFIVRDFLYHSRNRLSYTDRCASPVHSGPTCRKPRSKSDLEVLAKLLNSQIP